MSTMIKLDKQEINCVDGALGNETCSNQGTTNSVDNTRETVRTIFAGIGAVTVTFLSMYYMWHGINKCTSLLTDKKAHSTTCTGCMKTLLNVILNPKSMLQSQLKEDKSLA